MTNGTITPENLKKMSEKPEDFVLIDVREPSEYEEYNIGGELIPLGDLPEKISEGSLNELKERKVVVHCRSGQRSLMACELLRNSGFQEVYNLKGGALAWQELYG